MPIAVALIFLVIGSLIFHFMSPWTFTPIASAWDKIDQTIDITFVVAGIVFVAVNLFMAYAIVKYRKKEGEPSKARYEPENKKLETWLTGLTALGVAAMLAPGLLVFANFVNVPDGALEVVSLLPGVDQVDTQVGMEDRDRETREPGAGSQIGQRLGGVDLAQGSREGGRVQHEPLSRLDWGAMAGEVDPASPLAQ